MAFVESNKILVFPTTNRGEFGGIGKYITEYNLVNIINRLVDKKAFVISNSYTSPFEFNIYGYYFKVNVVDDIINAASNGDPTSISPNSFITATIMIDTAENGMISLAPLNKDDLNINSNVNIIDTNDKFIGVKFGTSPTYVNLKTESLNAQDVGSSVTTDSFTRVTFTILQRVGNTYEIPQESWVAFTSNRVHLDDGTL